MLQLFWKQISCSGVTNFIMLNQRAHLLRKLLTWIDFSRANKKFVYQSKYGNFTHPNVWLKAAHNYWSVRGRKKTAKISEPIKQKCLRKDEMICYPFQQAGILENNPIFLKLSMECMNSMHWVLEFNLTPVQKRMASEVKHTTSCSTTITRLLTQPQWMIKLESTKDIKQNMKHE